MVKTLLVSLILSSCLLNAQLQQSWVNSYNGAGDFNEKFNDVVANTAGDLYMVGYAIQKGNSEDALVVKYNSGGDTLWTRTFDGAGNGQDEANAVVIDNLGSIYVCGYQKGNGTGDDYLIIKYNSLGDTLWTRTFDAIGQDDQAIAMAIDQNHIFITGYCDNDASAATNNDIVTLMYDFNGALIWQKTFAGAANSTDQPAAIVADKLGSCYLTGRSSLVNKDDDFITIKYNSSGIQLWANTFDAGKKDRANDLVLGATYLYVTGRTNNGTDDDFYTIAYSYLGAKIWEKRYDGIGAGNDVALAITVDANENVFVTGQSDVDITTLVNYDAATIKYNNSGTQLWTASYNSSANKNDVPANIIADNSGAIYICGKSDMSSSAIANNDLFVAKYSSAGAKLWNVNYPGSATQNDAATNLIFDNNANIAIAGYLTNSNSMKDAAAFKISSAGTLAWQKQYVGFGDNSDNLNAMTVDASGNMYLGGSSFSNGSDLDMITIKINTSGDTLWTRKIDGTSNGGDEVTAIAIDPIGNILVSGYTKNKITSNDVTTIKYNSTGDTLWKKVYNYSSNQSDKAQSMALDAQGNVYVAAYSNSSTNAINNDDFLLLKYAASGTLLFAQRFNGTGNSTDRPAFLKLGATGVFIAGKSFNGTDDDILILKYDFSGNLLWSKTFLGVYGDDKIYDLLIDAADNLFWCGATTAASAVEEDAVLQKYNSTGTLQFTKTYSGSANGNDRFAALGVDKNGNLICAGRSDMHPDALTTMYDALLTKYNSAGQLQWTKTYDSPNQQDDDFSALALTDSATIFTLGQSNQGTALNKNNDLLLLHYNALGTVLWDTTYAASSGGNDAGKHLLLQNKKVLCAGETWGVSGQKNLLWMQYALPGATSISPNNRNASLSVYPNPAEDVATIKTEGLEGILTLRITDVLGNILLENNFCAQQPSTINKNDLAPGIYYIQVLSDNKQIVQSIPLLFK